MAQQWPSSLPLDIQDSDEEFANNLVRTPMDVGPDKLRRRTTANIKPFSGVMYMTTAEVEIFETFYYNTLESGVLSFYFYPPRKTVVYQCRFASIPQVSTYKGDYWKVIVDMEVLPFPAGTTTTTTSTTTTT